LPWAVTFPQDSVPYTALVAKGFLSVDAAGSLPLHPTQLYSSVNALVLALLTGTYFKFRRRDGEVLALGLIVYPITRFVLEILRFDEPGRFGTSLTISQWISIGMLLIGLSLAFWIAKRGELRVEG
jgi:phosphatidylglycerol---prolipoprotein diacylglyceryl transferase